MNEFETNLAVIETEFPRIVKNIRFLWGNKEFYPYMDKLLNDSRDGTRKGFKFQISLALMKVVEIHDGLFPTLIPLVKDIWSDSRYE